MKHLSQKKAFLFAVSALFLNTFSDPILASDFSLPFYNGSELGNAYAGWAAAATDASTAYSNPAGLTRLTKPQLVVGAVDVVGRTQFRGTTSTIFTPPQTGTGSGNAGGFGPLFYISAPLSKNIVFGFGSTAPFGLGTNYPKDSLVRYLATRTKVVDIDFTPNLGFKINEKFSVGLGLDIQRLIVTINGMLPTFGSTQDSENQNHTGGWGYGWHGGLLYQVLPTTRVGFSYNSQTMFHTYGNSVVFTPDATFRTTHQKINTPLPGRAQLSLYHDITPCWAVMGTIFYTRWSVINNVIMRNTMTPPGIAVPVTLPFYYHDTFDYAAGLNFKPSQKWILKTGIQYFNTPSNNRYRSVADPVGQMILLGVGAHYQQNKCIGYDLGYAHDFFQQTVINNITTVSSAIGHSNTFSNVISGQVTWDI